MSARSVFGNPPVIRARFGFTIFQIATEATDRVGKRVLSIPDRTAIGCQDNARDQNEADGKDDDTFRVGYQLIGSKTTGSAFCFAFMLLASIHSWQATRIGRKAARQIQERHRSDRSEVSMDLKLNSSNRDQLRYGPISQSRHRNVASSECRVIKT